jgi:hypothetical protein
MPSADAASAIRKTLQAFWLRGRRIGQCEVGRIDSFHTL